MGVDPKDGNIALMLASEKGEGRNRHHAIAAEGDDAVRLMLLDDRPRGPRHV
ncbi:hypothetical protein [Methylobacterium sp. WL103]|uniref:hypothetical protein n=1 Tax=Methylobacterium sp. WL103 TaxID=2603891 RepID=UPI001FF010BB|nr:hypothetical protein [Methylobacterium sp. WL103]